MTAQDKLDLEMLMNDLIENEGERIANTITGDRATGKEIAKRGLEIRQKIRDLFDKVGGY